VTGLRALVVDDEPLARRRLLALLSRRPEIGSVAEAVDGEAALAALRRDPFDLVFLDVQMPGLDGLGVARALGAAEMPAVVFVTAFDRFALAAFELDAVDYLLKPFDDERFGEAVERALRRLDAEALAAMRGRLGTLLDRLATAPAPVEHVTVEKGGRTFLLPAREIDWVRAAGNYVELHARGETFLVRATLKAVAERLPAPRFLRIHRSIVVNLDRVVEIERRAVGEDRVVMADGTRLALSRRHRAGLPGLGSP
jgi:two-component system LytT family response regulator